MNYSELLFVFTTTPAGLGHIRVMDAIKDGRPAKINSVDIGVLDIKANRIHDLGSRYLPFVKLTEFYQTNPVAESLVTAFYTQYLKRHTQDITVRFLELGKQYPNIKKWVVVSTHFALAHSISAAKDFIEKKLGIKIYLCVVVTDDSPQKIWAVQGSDITFVPSEVTKDRLSRFFSSDKKDSVKVISYPLAPRLTQKLKINEFQFVVDQVDPNKNLPLQIEIPISGAAVQTDYFEKFIGRLARENFVFTVIGQESMLTKTFFEKVQALPHVQLSIGKDAWQTVKYYESLYYQPNRPSIEITKPSEQTFKALLDPRQRGGVILLLTSPIGRQEYDNLKFLERHGLKPTTMEQKQLFIDEDLRKWVPKAKYWRAISIPEDPIKATYFVEKLKRSGIFYAMLSCVVPKKQELMDNGVFMIWEEIQEMVS